jgi:hypothetical protein
MLCGLRTDIRLFPWLQDLNHAEFHLWSGSLDRIVTSDTKPFFNAYQRYIHLHSFNYTEESKGTPFEGDPFFGNEEVLKRHLNHSATYSDLVRMLLLHNYGGQYPWGGY